MFGAPDIVGPIFPGTQTGHTGDQVRGFGFFHDAGIDTVARFMSVIRPGPDAPGGIPLGPAGDVLISQVEAYLLAFDSNLAPVVGQQVTLSAAHATVTKPRIQLLRARADAGECDLIAKGRWAGSEVGFLYTGGGQFRRNRQALPQVSAAPPCFCSPCRPAMRRHSPAPLPARVCVSVSIAMPMASSMATSVPRQRSRESGQHTR